jgi:hypothetical protein
MVFVMNGMTCRFIRSGLLVMGGFFMIVMKNHFHGRAFGFCGDSMMMMSLRQKQNDSKVRRRSHYAE